MKNTKRYAISTFHDIRGKWDFDAYANTKDEYIKHIDDLKKYRGISKVRVIDRETKEIVYIIK